MSSNQSRRKRSWKNRKLELLIYIICGIAVVAIIIGTGTLFSRWGEDPITASSSSEDFPLSEVASAVGVLPESSDTASDDTSSASASSPSASSPSSSASASSQPSETSESSHNWTREELAQDLGQWYLQLVNHENLLSKDFTPPSTQSVSNGQKMDSRIYEAYEEMKSAAAQEGLNLWVLSGYRTYAKQADLFSRRVTRAQTENPEFTRQQAEEEAVKYVMRAGTSEHQLGLAIDFNDVETRFADTKEGKWLRENAHKYGFILRYDKDKVNITKVSYEPWHYRYVGVKHATKMKELDMCLEEYIDYLKGA